MTTETDTFIIRRRYIVPGNGWTREDRELLPGTTLYFANEVATTRASELDKACGDSHFWMVDIIGKNGRSYYQYFHGRTF